MSAIATFVSDHVLHGVDIDWETPKDNTEWDQCVNLLTSLKSNLPGKRISIAVAGYPSALPSTISQKIWNAVDAIHLKTYDEGSPWPSHSDATYSTYLFDGWATQGAPKGKLFLGCAFYGWHPVVGAANGGSKVPYRNIVLNGASCNKPGDNTASITTKTEYCYNNGYGGVFIWEIGFDIFNTLLNATWPVISDTSPICSGTSKSFSSTNWHSGDYSWEKSSNLSLSNTTNSTTTVSPANSSSYGAAWVRVKNTNTGAVLATYEVWIGVPDPFLYLLIEGQDGLYPPGWYITNYITACPLQFIALYPKYYEPAGILEFQGQSSNISRIKFSSPTSITFKTTKKVGEMFSFDIRYRNTCGWSSSWATIDIENVNCSKSPVLEEYKWKVYPNPIDNMLYIEQDMEDFGQSTSDMIIEAASTYDIRLYDGQGNLLRQTNTKGGTVQFNVANLPVGFYYLHVHEGASAPTEIHQVMVER